MNIFIVVFVSFSSLSSSHRSDPSIYSDTDFIQTVIQKQPNREIYLHQKPEKSVPNLNIQIPKSFDSRDKWPMCESLKKIRNHNQCGAGWAFSAVSTISDRLCIQTGGKMKVELSPQDLVSCCENCGGCNVGNSTEAWKFWMEYGIVSGGDYNEEFEGCLPYSESSDRFGEVPVCEKQCYHTHPGSYSTDKHYGDSFYKIPGGGSSIQIEILTHGPVQAGLEVYEDFFAYRKGNFVGVYRRKKDSKYVGYTYVKLIGWGRERNLSYWLGVTSWGTGFGSLNGNFKILRGKNEAGIEGNVVAGLARVNRNSLVRVSSGCESRTIWRVVFGLLGLKMVLMG